jgi:hypothetical protein
MRKILSFPYFAIELQLAGPNSFIAADKLIAGVIVTSD